MKKFMATLAALGPAMGKEITPGILGIYEMALAEYPEENLLACIPELAKGEFFPKPYNFVQLLAPEGPSIEDQANAAWSGVQAWASGKGEPTAPFAIAAMPKTMDLYMIKHASESELRGYGFEYRASYRVLAEQEKNEATLDLIEGRAATMIGDTAKTLGMGE